MGEMIMPVIWLAAVVVFGIVEAATLGLVAIWFSAGSLAAMIAALLGAPLWLQIVLFLAVSGVVLYFARDMAQKYINRRHIKTNADRIVGGEAIVIQAINNERAEGQVRMVADGQIWTARSADGESIPADTIVKVSDIAGVKAMVKRINKEEEQWQE
ncbi:MAG: NfeD family protein [Clostridia bacterium]|nr:NfeD family protein [Clostridia bacterium]